MRSLENSGRVIALPSRLRKPDFFIVGAAKSGTSSLYNYLIQHPNVFMPEVKEPHFFYDRDSAGAPVLLKKDPREYLKLFEGVPDDVRAGEASTSYLYLANAAREIRQVQKHAKILMVLRNPVDRAYSQYWNQVRDGQERLSFEDALQAEEKRKKQNSWYGFLYVETGLYAEQVARYTTTFGRDNVQVHLYEDLHQDAKEVCRKVFSFLGVDRNYDIETTKVYNRSGPTRSKFVARTLNTRQIKEPIARVMPQAWKRGLGEWLRDLNRKPVPEMNLGTREMLLATFKEDISRLEHLIGRDLSQWRT